MVNLRRPRTRKTDIKPRIHQIVNDTYGEREAIDYDGEEE